MGITEYAFATYVFILLFIGMWLFGKLIRPAHKKSSKKQSGEYEKEQKLFNLYQNIEDMLAGFEEFTEETRAELEKTKSEITEMLEKAKRICEAAQITGETKNNDIQETAVFHAPVITPASAAARAVYKAVANIRTQAEDIYETPEKQPEILKAAEDDAETGNTTVAAVNGLSPLERVQLKIPDKVADMSAKGLDMNDIAQQLGISVREVALAMKIRKVK